MLTTLHRVGTFRLPRSGITDPQILEVMGRIEREMRVMWNLIATHIGGSFDSGEVDLVSGSKAVTFSSPFPTDDYSVAISSDKNETMRWDTATKATTGFTIYSSNTASTAKCTWVAFG